MVRRQYVDIASRTRQYGCQLDSFPTGSVAVRDETNFMAFMLMFTR